MRCFDAPAFAEMRIKACFGFPKPGRFFVRPVENHFSKGHMAGCRIDVDEPVGQGGRQFWTNGSFARGLEIDRQRIVAADQSSPHRRRLDAAFLSGTTTIVRNRRDVFDQFDVQARGLQRRDRTFASAAGTLDANFDVTHPELLCLFGGLLCRTLAGKRRAFSRAFETARSRRCPAQGVALGVGDRHGGVVEGRIDVRNARIDIATNTFLFIASRLGHE